MGGFLKFILKFPSSLKVKIKSVFEKKKSVPNLEKKMSSVSVETKLVSTETENVEVQATKTEAILFPLEETNLSCSSGATANPPVVYRWDDESNGEIYTDKPILDENLDNETTTSVSDSIGLYVVENGREYPFSAFERKVKVCLKTRLQLQFLKYYIMHQ